MTLWPESTGCARATPPSLLDITANGAKLAPHVRRSQKIPTLPFRNVSLPPTAAKAQSSKLPASRTPGPGPSSTALIPNFKRTAARSPAGLPAYLPTDSKVRLWFHTPPLSSYTNFQQHRTAGTRSSFTHGTLIRLSVKNLRLLRDATATHYPLLESHSGPTAESAHFAISTLVGPTDLNLVSCLRSLPRRPQTKFQHRPTIHSREIIEIAFRERENCISGKDIPHLRSARVLPCTDRYQASYKDAPGGDLSKYLTPNTLRPPVLDLFQKLHFRKGGNTLKSNTSIDLLSQNGFSLITRERPDLTGTPPRPPDPRSGAPHEISAGSDHCFSRFSVCHNFEGSKICDKPP